MDLTSEEQIDALWRMHVGSSKLTPRAELITLRGLRGKLPMQVVYKLYLRSKIWRAMRYRVLKRDGFACVKCGSANMLQVNHKVYSEFGSEKLSDLETLCRLCHADITKKFDLMMNVSAKRIDVKDGKFHLVLRRRNI
jgi:hypothetical protein